MDWDKVTKDAFAQLRKSRLRQSIRSDGAAISGVSLEDYMQSAVLEYLQVGGSNIELKVGETHHEALVRTVCEVAYRKAENDRRKTERRSLKHQELRTLDGMSGNVEIPCDPFLPILILEAVKDDDEAKLVVICILDGMADFDDTKFLSEITQLSNSQVENAKKRVRRKVQHLFTDFSTAFNGKVQ